MALDMIRADVPMSQSQLADALQNPNLNQAEKDAILQELASGDEAGLAAFYANDAARTIRDDPTLASDQQIIGEALQQAYEDGLISADDLLRIADVNQAGNGAQRLLAILESGGGGGANGSVEALSDALWERNGNDGLDRAVAAIGYTSSPELQSRNLNTPELRREAFEALVAFNEAAPYKDISFGSAATQWEHSALNAAGTLFVNNSAELIDFYTGANGGTVQTETLARFMAQTVFNPDAPADSREQEGLIEQFARLDAAISGGVAVAMDRYSDEILANEASKQQFASIVGALVGKTPASKVPGSNLIVKEVAEAIYDALSSDPERPEQALAGVIHDAHFDQVRELADELGQTGLTSAFNGAYSAELQQIQQNLNVNLGGHKD